MDLLRSLPIGLYLEQPITWVHRLDARVKLLWLMSFLITPLLSSAIWLLSLVILLILITLSAQIPLRVWKKQMGWLLMFCSLMFIIACFLPDGLTVEHQARLPNNEITFVQPSPQLSKPTKSQPWKQFQRLLRGPTQPTLPQPTDYRYILFQQGPLTITRRSFDLGIRLSSLLFTLVYSTNLYLLTTASEEITVAIENLMEPLRRFNIPITEIALTLTLSLRFFPLVLEEIQNLIRSVRTRAINWKKLGFRRATQVWLIVAERLLENLLLRAEQMASAMTVRGFTHPNQHRVEWYQPQLHSIDGAALIGLAILWIVRIFWGMNT
ncbi:MAG: CbiQ family ECF transporter T component [Microcoleaceae cyanobacterium]